MSKTKILFINFLPTMIISFLLVILVYAAWQGPTEPPPKGNVPPPINVGPIEQTKQGNLIIRGSFKAYGGSDNPVLTVVGSNVGIGTINPQAKLDVAGSFLAEIGRLNILPQNNTDEGGEIRLAPPGSSVVQRQICICAESLCRRKMPWCFKTITATSSYNEWNIDNYKGYFRLHHDGGVFLQLEPNGSLSLEGGIKFNPKVGRAFVSDKTHSYQCPSGYYTCGLDCTGKCEDNKFRMICCPFY